MRIPWVFLIAALTGATACSSPDDASGDVHLVLVSAPETATPGSLDFQSIIVKVVNGDGTPIAGVPVTWTVKSGGGRLRVSADTSGVDGLAAVQWVPGLLAGSQEVGAYLYDQPALVITVNTEVLHADKLATTFQRGCGLLGTVVWCWRDDYPAQSTRRILSQIAARDIAASYWFACVLDPAGTTYCNRAFEDSDPEASLTISGLPPLKSLSAGVRFFCGVALADDTPWCWQDFAMVPTHKFPSPALSGLSTGSSYACGLDSAGSAWCWTLPVGSPTLIQGGHAFQSVSVSDDGASACGIQGADVWCWLSGALPVRVPGVTARQVALGWPFSLLNTAPVSVVARLELYWTGVTTLFYEVYDDRAFPLPVRQVYPTCVLTYDNAAYCVAVVDVNADVIPVPSYWKAVAASRP